MPATTSSRHYLFIEIARVFVIPVVVLMHVHDLLVPAANGVSLHTFISPFIRFVIPAFLMISGMVLGLRHRDPHYHVTVGDFWYRRLYSLIIPFLTWNAVYIVISAVASGRPMLTMQNLVSITTGYMHLYFIFVLLQFLLIYSLMSNAITTRQLLWCLCAAMLCSVAFYSISEMLLRSHGADQHRFEWTYGKLCLGWAVFFFWGLWLGYSPATMDFLKRNHRWFFAAALCAFMPYGAATRNQLLEFGSLSRDYFLLTGLPYQFLAGTWLLAWLYRLENHLQSSPLALRIAGMGKYVFHVYMAHLAILIGVISIWQSLSLNSSVYLQIPVISAITLLANSFLIQFCNLPPLALMRLLLFGGRGD